MGQKDVRRVREWSRHCHACRVANCIEEERVCMVKGVGKDVKKCKDAHSLENTLEGMERVEVSCKSKLAAWRDQGPGKCRQLRVGSHIAQSVKVLPYGTHVACAHRWLACLPSRDGSRHPLGRGVLPPYGSACLYLLYSGSCTEVVCCTEPRGQHARQAACRLKPCGAQAHSNVPQCQPWPAKPMPACVPNPTVCQSQVAVWQS